MKTKCGSCGAKYEYEEEDAGTSIPCECGAAVMLEKPPAKEVAKTAMHHCPGCDRDVATVFWLPKKGVCATCHEKAEDQAKERDAARERERQREAWARGRVVEQVKAREVPDYISLAVLSVATQTVGAIMIVAGVFLFVVGMLRTETEAMAIFLCSYGGGVAVSGLLFCAAGQALECLRRMAINSCLARNELMDLNVRISKLQPPA